MQNSSSTDGRPVTGGDTEAAPDAAPTFVPWRRNDRLSNDEFYASYRAWFEDWERRKAAS